MKNFFRVCSLLLLLGVVLCIGGAAAGGVLYGGIDGDGLRPIVSRLPRLRWESQEEYDLRTGAGRSRGSVWAGSGKTPEGVSDRADDMPDDAERTVRLKKMDFDLGAGDYTIIEGDDYWIECAGSWVESSMEDGEWRIRTDMVLTNFLNEDRSCTITVPEGCMVESLDWRIGAANVTVYADISAEKASFEVGAGNLELDCLDASRKIDVETGAGSVLLGLAGSWSDYRIGAEVAMGSISVNGEDLISGLAGTCSKGEGGRKISAEIGMGTLSILTERP